MTVKYGRKALHALAVFLPEFEATGFRFMHIDSSPRWSGHKEKGIVSYRYDPLVYKFWDAVERHFWLSSFEWTELSKTELEKTEEARQLQGTPAVLTQASAEELSRLLSMYYLLERYGDGILTWLSLWESGLLLGILRRAEVLTHEHENEA